ncbi:hypothetical protein EMEDMD4_510054 [Sinorhizobium medicae]|uniref:Uncharacterized protein n=1 Tax=Sinorhizobium medicae TaxID=110321 RepID=A0A508X2D8_9HYPH|nr:hypothetical protein EMEDMD4_510054 [Sinorhizobium medicae]
MLPYYGVTAFESGIGESRLEAAKTSFGKRVTVATHDWRLLLALRMLAVPHLPDHVYWTTGLRLVLGLDLS